jgi:hypothetical protein
MKLGKAGGTSAAKPAEKVEGPKWEEEKLQKEK